MTVEEADWIDLKEVAGIEEGATGIRVTWRNGDREFVDGGAAERLLWRWRRMVGGSDVKG